MDTDVEVDAENKLILVNTERIESDFKEKQFEVGKEGPKSYTKRGLEPFMINDTFSTLQSYYRYVMEREYLRAEGVETEDLNKIALINTFNPNVIMRNIKHSYTQQVMDIIQKYGSQLSKYTVLQQLTPSISSPLLNVLTLNDKQLVDGTLSNNYAQQIRDLGNERIRKISIPGDKEKEKAVNKEISRIFYLLPLMAVYQHGVGPTISGFNEILPQDHYLSVMNNASNLFKEHYFNAETLMAIFNRLTDSKESYTYNHKTYAMSLPTSKDTFVYEAPQFEDTVSNTDQFQYFGAMYSIVLEDGVGIDVVDYKGKPSAKAKLLAAYNTNKNVDPQNGKPFRSADQNIEEEPPVLPVEPEGADNNQNDTYSFTFANGITVDTPFQLNPEQQAALLALENFYRNPDKHNGKVTLVGYAGTGKTSIISIFDKWLQQVEFLPQLIYTSPTHRANAVTKLKNPNARVFTLHKLFGLGLQVVVDPTSKDYDAKYDTITVGRGTIKIKPNDTLIVDESSMVTDGLYDFLMQMKERFKLKIIFMGDPGQLGPVQDAGILSKVFSDPTSTIRLTQVMRTGDNPILKESTALRSGGELSYVSSETNGKGVEYTNDQARMNQIISSNMKKMMDSENYLYFRVLTATNNSAAEVNKAVRRVIFGEEAKEQLVYGDIIMGHANFGVDYKSGQPKIINSGDYKVVSIRKDESKTVYVPNEPALPEMFRGKELKFKGYRISLQNVLDTSETPVENLFVPYIGQNDENIRMLGETVAEMNKAAQEIHKTNKSKGAELYSTASSLESQLLLMEDGKGRTEKTKLKKYIDYGYAHTIHKSQGGTYTAVMVMDDTIAPLTKYIQKKRSEKGNVMTDEEAKTMQRQLKYVAVSRATDYVYIATDSGTNKSIYDGETYTEPGENGVTITGMSLSDIGEAPSNVKPAGRTGNSTTTINGATVVLGNQADFVGNSGAAKGSDAYFNYKSSGHPVSFMNWHNQGMLNRKKSGLEPDLLLPLMDNNPQALITDESEFAKVVEIGAKRLGKEARRPATINKLGRNWLQVKNSDAIFAVADSFYTRPDTNQLDMSNVAGGTGWAIAYAAEKIDGVERPIYVYVQSKNRWYKYNYNKGVFEEYNQTPVLTKRFAGIGTRDLKDNGKLAIDNLYKNTFSGQSTTQPTSVKPRIDLSREWKGDLESRPIYTADGVNTMRTSSAKADENFGNPFSEAGYSGTIKVPSIGAAVIAYKEWLLGTNHKDVKPQQREWILDQINQGKLDRAILLYAGKSAARGEGMHPTALAEVVEQLRSNKPSTQPTEPTVNTFTSSPINKGAEVEPGLEMFKNALTLDEQKVFFEFGKRVLEKNAYNPFSQYAMASAGQLEWSPELVIDKNGKEVERQGNYDQAIISIQKNKTGSEGSEKRWTYHYYLSNVDGSPIEPIPSNVISILEKITGQSMADYDTVLINLYPIGRTLGWHQDITEDYRNADRDIISVSIGASSDFIYANPGNKIMYGPPKGDTRTLQVNSGDVMLFGGKSRLIKHTVTNVAGTTNLGSINLQNSNVNDGFVGGKTLENWRMNFTFRVANPNNNKGKRGVTKTSSSGPQRFEGQMTYKYNDNGRPGLIADTTFDAILTGEGTATTIYEKDGKLDYWKQVKVGDIITWEAADGRKVDVVVTKALYKLKGSGMIPKEWAELEGWSSMYFIDKVLPKIDDAYQLQYKLINPKQYGDISNNDIFDDSDESDLENNCPVPF
jgi:alkylated DNA repair dioxygenase AlkB